MKKLLLLIVLLNTPFSVNAESCAIVPFEYAEKAQQYIESQLEQGKNLRFNHWDHMAEDSRWNMPQLSGKKVNEVAIKEIGHGEAILYINDEDVDFAHLFLGRSEATIRAIEYLREEAHLFLLQDYESVEANEAIEYCANRLEKYAYPSDLKEQMAMVLISSVSLKTTDRPKIPGLAEQLKDSLSIHPRD